MHACSFLLSQLGGGGYGCLESRGQGFCSEPHTAQAHPPPRTTQPQMLVVLRLEAPGCRFQAATEDADPSAKSWLLLPMGHWHLQGPSCSVSWGRGQRQRSGETGVPAQKGRGVGSMLEKETDVLYKKTVKAEEGNYMERKGKMR